MYGVLIAVLVAMAGCGSSSSTSSTGGTTAPGVTAAKTTPSGTTSSGTPSFTTAGNCQQLVTLGAKFAQAIQASSGGGKLNLQAVVNAYQALAAAAPSAIKPDLQLIANAFAKFAAALAKVGYTPGTQPNPSQLAALQAAAQAFNSPQLHAAAQHIQAWARQNCGNLTPTTTTG